MSSRLVKHSPGCCLGDGLLKRELPPWVWVGTEHQASSQVEVKGERRKSHFWFREPFQPLPSCLDVHLQASKADLLASPSVLTWGCDCAVSTTTFHFWTGSSCPPVLRSPFLHSCMPDLQINFQPTLQILHVSVSPYLYVPILVSVYYVPFL